MIKRQKRMMVLATITVFMATALFFPGLVSAGNLEPLDDPGPTMHTLEQIYNQGTSESEQIYNKPIWKIWGKTFKDWPGNDRFTVSVDRIIIGGGIIWGDMVLDKETGLMWEKSPDTTTEFWTSACTHCYMREVDNRKGWRLPTVEELASLIDNDNPAPNLPTGHPFSNVQSSHYWSSTTSALYTSEAWYVYFYNGLVGNHDKSNLNYVWCVRGGHGHNAY